MNLVNYIRLSWWKFILSKPRNLRAIFCRMGQHKAGVWWFNMGGFEPDMHCKNCGDDLG